MFSLWLLISSLPVKAITNVLLRLLPTALTGQAVQHRTLWVSYPVVQFQVTNDLEIAK